MSDNIFTCSGCKARFRVTKAPSSGKLKCPKCGVIAPFKPTPAASAQATQIAPAPAAAAAPPPPLPLGAVVSGHKILQFVGASEQTASYKAAQTSMGRNVLFRVLQPAYAKDAGMREAFFTEARSAAKLNHPNIISVFDMGQEGDTCFYTMEYMEGGTLTQYLAKNEKLTSVQRLAIATQISQAFSCADIAGLKASSVEPDHVLLTDRGDVRISHMGGGVVGGGSPKPMAYLLRRLLFLVLSGKDLPQQARMPGVAASTISMPHPHDALAAQMNAVVERLIKNPEATIANTTAELEKLTEENQRRSTVHEATSGTVPRRLSRAHEPESNKKLIIGGIAAGVLIIFFVIYFLMQNAKVKEAEALWATAQKQFTDGLVYDALENYQQIIEKYPKTPSGIDAPAELDKVKLAAIKQEFASVRREFQDKPEQLMQMRAAVVSKSEWLQANDRLKVIPGIIKTIKEEEERALKSVEVIYSNAAISEWKNQKSHDQIQKLCQQMQYGEALRLIQAGASKWSETNYTRDYYAKYTSMVNESAKRKFTEIFDKVEQLMAGNQLDQATAQLELIKQFGLEDYTLKANKKLEEINRLKGN